MESREGRPQARTQRASAATTVGDDSSATRIEHSADAISAGAPAAPRFARRFARFGGAGGAAAALATAARGAGSAGPPAAAVHLLVDRATLGWTQEDAAQAHALGWDGWVEQQLAWESIDDSALETRLAGFPSLAMGAKQIADNYTAFGNIDIAKHELRSATLMRGVLSRRVLYERMVAFWRDHFTIDQDDNYCQVLTTVYDREVLRRHALGNFRELLHAVAESGAMLYYLDNFSNVAGAPNENYARELLELHTLGVDGPYTEQDVREVARCFTGWTLYPTGHPQYGALRFLPAQHDNGPKVVLGRPLPPGGGELDGRRVLDALVQHPSTAAYLAQKLGRWFLGGDPPAHVLDAAAQAFLATGGELKPMLRVLLGAGAFAAARVGERPRLKRPFHFATSLLRALRADVRDASSVLDSLVLLGMPPHEWPTPDGYPDSYEAWSGGLHARWRFATAAAANQLPGIAVDLEALVLPWTSGQRTGQPVSVGEALSQVLTGGRLPPRTVHELDAYARSFPQATPLVLAETCALAASSPAYQLH